MNKHQSDYYTQMFHNERLMCFKEEDTFKCFMTFYICNDAEPYVSRDDQWQVYPDNPRGSICYIDHLLTDKGEENPSLSLETFSIFKNYILKTFPRVTHLRWNRWKNNKLYIYFKKLKEDKSYVYD